MRNLEGFSEGMSEDGFNQFAHDSIYGYILLESMTAFTRKKKEQVGRWLALLRDIDQGLRCLIGDDPKSDDVQTQIARHYDVARSIWGVIGGLAITTAEYKSLAGIYKRSDRFDEKPDLRFSRFMRMAMEYFAKARLLKKKRR